MNSYDTIANRQYKRQAEIAFSIIEEQVATDPDRYFTSLGKHIRIPKVDNDRLPYWGQPITVGDRVYIDTRAFLGKDGRVKNTIEHNILLERAVMEHVWQNDPAIFEGISSNLSVIYAEWVAGGICVRYNASEVDRGKFIVILTYYFMSMIYERLLNGRAASSDDVKLVVLKTLVRSGKLPSSYVDAILTDMPNYITEGNLTLNSVATAMKEMSTIEMGKFDYQTIMQLLGGGSWMGANATLLAITALEYPPLFLVLLKNTVSISTYKNKTRIGRAANSVDRQSPSATAIRTVETLVSEYIPESDMKQLGR